MTDSLSEFDLIAQFFTRPAKKAQLGVGDDCALLHPLPGQRLAISTDMLVEGRHFFPHVDAASLGHKALAVNLSDLAAMGAQPYAFTLSLALPEADPIWLSHFSRGLFALADQADCELIGGDTTKSPLITLSITVLGYVPADQALQRHQAQVGDDIWVSGTLGDARLALGMLWHEWSLSVGELAHLRRKLEWPEPRLALGRALLPLAHAALDLSDGLVGDLQHVLQRSQVGADISLPALPLSETLQRQPIERQWQCALFGGDDYELCFTAAPAQRDAIATLSRQLALPLTRIGQIKAQAGLRLLDQNGQPVPLSGQAFDHFKSTS